MVIKVEKGLDIISNYLKSKGYHIIEESDLGYDIYIYSSDNYSGLYNNLINEADDHNTNTVLMINANHKSFEEIEEIVNNKKYSNLFEREGFF